MRKISLSVVITILISIIYIPTALMQQNRSQTPVRVSTSDGQTTELYQGSYALVIGASDYEHWNKLPGVKEDVVVIKAALEKQGFKVEELSNPTSSVFEVKLKEFITKYGLKKSNRLLIYFAGHGETLTTIDGRKQGYIVLIDAPRPNQDEAGFKRLAVNMRIIENYAKDIESNHAMFILDSCFSGSIFKRENENKVPPVITHNTLKSVRQFITAGDEKQTVPDRSIFRRWFVRGLEGEADQNGDGYITGTELGDFVKNQVTNESNRTQTPRAEKIMDVDLNEGDMIFPLDLSSKRREEEQYWASISKNSVGQLAEYIAKYPQGKYVSEAIGIIKKLEKEPAVNNVTASSTRPTFPAPSGRVAPPTFRSYNYDTLILDKTGKVKEKLTGQASYYEEDLGVGIKLEMVYVPNGSYEMGNDEKEGVEFIKEVKRYCESCSAEEWVNWAKPQHQVRVEGFYIGKYEVTQGQWKAIIGSNLNPSYFKGDDSLPVESVSWEEVKEFCKKLSEKTGREYRLPSEAEWEYGARGGTTTAFGLGETITPQVVNYDGSYPYEGATKGEYRGKTVKVGSLGIANGYGLYDMAGNVWEWCEDGWHDSYKGAPTDGKAWEGGTDNSRRVLRGGSWFLNASLCRSAIRLRYAPGVHNDLGFRVVVGAARTLK